jgi:hypothetical protein
MTRSRQFAAQTVFATTLLAMVCLLTSACQWWRPPVEPSIQFSAVPSAAEGGSDSLVAIAGRVAGHHPGDHIVVYARSGVWWVQPFTVRPFTEIAADSTWTSNIHQGTEYAALLVRPDFRPPATIEALPRPGSSVIAVASVKGAGEFAAQPRKTLTFSGYEWEQRQKPSDRGGANDYWPDHAWTDAAGALHLKLAERDGRWRSAEVSLTRPLGYGTYAFVVRDTAHLDPAAALSLVTWDDQGADQNHRELDVEISQWGDPAIKNAQFVVQPYYVAANVSRFQAPAGRLTHTFRWEPERASFKTLSGDGTVPGARVVEQHDFTSGIPTPGNETVRINLYYFRYSPLPPQGEVEVVIEKFQYLP